MVNNRQEKGYVALLAVLIIGAAALAISLALLTAGADSQRSALIELRSKQARSVAIACGQEALQQIHDNIAFTASNISLTQGADSCTYSVTATSGNARTIATSATAGNVVRKAQAYVTIGSSSISITSWQEVN